MSKLTWDIKPSGDYVELVFTVDEEREFKKIILPSVDVATSIAEIVVSSFNGGYQYALAEIASANKFLSNYNMSCIKTPDK